MTGRSAAHAVAKGRVDRRDEIAKVAYELIAERGISGLSLRAVARQLGATTGLVNHHFLDRAELVAAALDHASTVMTRRTIAAGGPATHPYELLKRVLPTDAEAVENWRFALSVRTGALVDHDLRRFDEGIAKRWRDALPGLMRPHLAGGGGEAPPLTPEEIEEACEHLVLMVDGIALRATLHPKVWPAERQHEHLRLAFEEVAPGSTSAP